jgi:hypothetical protein
VRFAVASARRFPRNGTEKDKKRVNKTLRLSTAEASRRVAADRRRLQNAEIKFAAVQQDAGANCLL